MLEADEAAAIGSASTPLVAQQLVAITLPPAAHLEVSLPERFSDAATHGGMVHFDR